MPDAKTLAEEARAALRSAGPIWDTSRVETAIEALAALARETDRSESRAIMFSDVIETHIHAMQAAMLEAWIGAGDAAALRWIRNTLAGPGHLPDANAAAALPEAKTKGPAQAWFDAQQEAHEAFRAAHPGPAALAEERQAGTPGLKRHALEAADELSKYAAAPFFPDTEKRGIVRTTTPEWWDGLAELIERAQPLITRGLRELTAPYAELARDVESAPVDALPELPPFPGHPEPHAMQWTRLEREAVVAYARAAQALVRGAPRPEMWRPIETVPQRVPVLLCEGELVGSAYVESKYIGPVGASGYECETDFIRPTHWMPLPIAHGIGTQPEAESAAARDAARYRWLRKTLQSSVGGGVEVNDEHLVYETPEPGQEVRVYWYPNTPVGFNQSHGSTMDDAIDAAMQAEQTEGGAHGKRF